MLYCSLCVLIYITYMYVCLIPDKSMGANFSPVAVTSPSQRRYVHYLESVKNLHTDYISRRPVLLTELKLSGQPHQDRECCNLTFVVENGTRVEFDYGKAHGLIACCASKTSDGVWSITLSTPVMVRYIYADLTETDIYMHCKITQQRHLTRLQ